MAITAKNTQGFTLIEILVTLMLAGIITVFAGMGIVRVIQGFLFTKENAATVQKGQMVMARLIKEFTVIKSIDEVSDAGSMKFKAQKWFVGEAESVEVTGTIELTSGNLVLSLDGNALTLTDQVSDFALEYYDADYAQCAPTSAGIIRITLTLEGADGVNSVFTNRVTPRNITGG